MIQALKGRDEEMQDTATARTSFDCSNVALSGLVRIGPHKPQGFTLGWLCYRAPSGLLVNSNVRR